MKNIFSFKSAFTALMGIFSLSALSLPSCVELEGYGHGGYHPGHGFGPRPHHIAPRPHHAGPRPHHPGHVGKPGPRRH